MTTHRYGKNLMTMPKTPMTPDMTDATSTITTYRSRSTVMNLINEALSRARMRWPDREAARPARRVVIEAHRRQAHELGEISQFLLR